MKQLHEVARMLSPKFPQATELLEEAAEEVLAHLHPSGAPPAPALDEPARAPAQGDQAPDEGRGDLPDSRPLMRIVGALLAEQDDEWHVADRRYFSVDSMSRWTPRRG